MGEDWISTSSQQEKNVAETAASHVESIHQDDRLHGADLRIDGDDADHDHETPMTVRRFLSFVALAFLWTGSQIPVYLFGGIPPYIYEDIGGADRWIWLILGNLLALAGICPFVGSISDLIGRRYIALIGASLLCIGMIVSSTAHSMNTFIGGMTISGAGAGINELTALAATAEMAPTKKRGKYVAILVFSILPFCPSVLWAQLIAYYSSWRYVGALCAAWNGVGLLMTMFFYFPPRRVNSKGLSRAQIISKIDYVGGFLSISGMVLFLAGLQWGGYQYSWHSAHVLAPLVLGIAFLIAFVIWEIYGTQDPFMPARLLKEPRTFGLTLLITFISGANFFSILMFWPTEAFNVYSHDPVQVGLRGLPIGFGILAGAFIGLWLLSSCKGRIRELMFASSCLMTAGCGAMAIARVDNLHQLWGILIVAALGIGGIVVPASIMTTIICPDDLVATVSALTLSIRVIGGGVGYTIYYNIFISKFLTNVEYYVGGVMMEVFHITDLEIITEAIKLTSASEIKELMNLPGIAGNQGAYDAVVLAGQMAFAESYKYVYYASIAFGGLAILASLGLKNIGKYMDGHVAVVMK